MVKKKRAVTLIMELMQDYQPRTSEQIADLTGISHGRVRSLLASEFKYETERKPVTGGGIVTFYSLKKWQLESVECLMSRKRPIG